MWKSVIVITCLIGYCSSGPLGSKHHVRFKARQNSDAPLTDGYALSSLPDNKEKSSAASTAKLNLPSNATSIRAEIKDGFSCEGRVYGYYADMENDCQIFHVCMPVAYGDGKEHYFRWSFICPEDTIFSQDSFTCMHRQDMLIECSESMKYYELNRNFGTINGENTSFSSHTSGKYDSDREVVTSSEDDTNSEKISATVQEDVLFTPKIQPVKKTQPFNRKPARPSTFAQKNKLSEPQVTELTKLNQPTKSNKRPLSHFKRNKPLRTTTMKPIEEAENTVTENILSKAITPKDFEKIEINTKQEGEKDMEINLQVPQHQTDRLNNDGTHEKLDNNKFNKSTTKVDIESTVEYTADEMQDEIKALPSTTENVVGENVLAISTLSPATFTEEEENFLKHTSGGFENVDPTMAAEAEALINNFLQTMLKTETTPSTVPIQQSSEFDAVEELNEDKRTDEKAEEIAIVQEFQEFSKKHEPSVSKIETQNVPMRHDIYEIPVTIIHTPLEEMPQKQQTAEIVAPISIDDVVASVKEHLERPSGIIDSDSKENVQKSSTIKAENDENIVPIYHRLKKRPEVLLLETEKDDLTQTADKSETESQSTNNPENQN